MITSGWNDISDEISSRSKSNNISAKPKVETKVDFSSVHLNNDTSKEVLAKFTGDQQIQAENAND